eukprot:1160759-Pelagomonas_calceolata.AAC.7
MHVLYMPHKLPPSKLLPFNVGDFHTASCIRTPIKQSKGMTLARQLSNGKLRQEQTVQPLRKDELTANLCRSSHLVCI